VAPFGVHILIEKPFASNLVEADLMIAAMANSGKQLVGHCDKSIYHGDTEAASARRNGFNLRGGAGRVSRPWLQVDRRGWGG